MTRQAAARQDNVALGIVVIIMTVFAMSTADAVIKYVSATFPLWQIYVLRSLIPPIPRVTMADRFAYAPFAALANRSWLSQR